MYVYYSFFIRSSVDGHLGCFHVLAVVNSAALNTGAHVSFSVTVSSVHVPSSGAVGSYGSCFLVFEGVTILFSIVAVSFAFPPTL